MSGAVGSFMTSVKFRPSGQVFCAPLHILVSSASGTSCNLLPADTTTARFLTAGNDGNASAVATLKTTAARSQWLQRFTVSIPAHLFARTSKVSAPVPARTSTDLFL